MIKSNQSRQSATLLKKDSIADLTIKLPFKLVYYCVFFHVKVTWSAFNLYQRPKSLIEYTKYVSYEFLIVFDIFQLRWLVWLKFLSLNFCSSNNFKDSCSWKNTKKIFSNKKISVKNSGFKSFTIQTFE